MTKISKCCSAAVTNLGPGGQTCAVCGKQCEGIVDYGDPKLTFEPGQFSHAPDWDGLD